MLWSLFQPPERNRSRYLFLLACISTSSFLSARASRPSVLSLKKTSFRHSFFSVYSRSSIGRTPMSTRLFCALCVYPISSCLKLSKAHSTYHQPSMCLLHYPALFLKHSTEGTHSGFLLDLARFLFNPSYFATVSVSFSVLSAAFS